MRLAKWPLRLPELQLETPVDANNRATTNARPNSRLPTVGRLRQSKINSRRGSLRPNGRRAANPIGCRPFHMSRLWMVPASSTVARSRQTTQPESATGSPESPRETASFLPRLLGHRHHRRPSSRLHGQSAQYKTSTQKSMEPAWCSPVWLMIDAAEGSSNKK